MFEKSKSPFPFDKATLYSFKILVPKSSSKLFIFASSIAKDKSLCINFEENPGLKLLSAGLAGPIFFTGK